MDELTHGGIIMYKMKYVVGIDEAGRGPLAGPVAVGAVKISRDSNKNFFRGIKDSKKLSSKKREEWFGLVRKAQRNGGLDFAVSLVSEKVIDRRGIVSAVALGIKRCLDKLRLDERESQLFLDGALRAPLKFTHQSTVVRGDEKIPVISLASIVAKVTRDRQMVRLSKRFPEFDFQTHKGYGTRAHRLAIQKHGPTILHRQSFLKH